MEIPIKLAVFGATGSIGQSALSLARDFPDKIKIVAMSAGKNVLQLSDDIIFFKPKLVAVLSELEREKLKEILEKKSYKPVPEIMVGPKGLEILSTESGAEVVLSAIVGSAGLKPTWAAIKKGLKIALANKESLVLAGELIMPLALDRLRPVDSEHSAIFQALGGTLTNSGLRRIILTASGGPFRGFSLKELEKVTVDMALNHPNWSMGPKITCDSASMMNKGLEIIEAHHLFQIPYDHIEVLVHPQSLVHSMVEFKDGSILAQLGRPDMRLALAYSLSVPQRWPLLASEENAGLSNFSPLDLLGELLFEPVNRQCFRAMYLAETAGRLGGTAPAILNGANEVAVAAFLEKKLDFVHIPIVIEECLNRVVSSKLTEIDEALEADRLGREMARKIISAF
jgi:1-deoxy-D-xylulose-5-phosphate reductoisomerase